MPGGLRSRGCDACRKRKKKCDLVQPVCGRCQSLRIACVGCNLQRWKFQDELVRGSSATTLSQAVAERHANEAPIPMNLNSQNSSTAARLMSVWSISELGYDISIYGHYFHFIPRRLGTNKSLDAATRSFALVHSSTYTGKPSREALQAYGTALKATKEALSNPDQCRSAELLCALHLLNLCQGWIYRAQDQLISYPAIVAHLLPDMISQDWTDPFERAQLLVACPLVISASMYSHDIPLHEDIMKPFLRRWKSPRPHTSRDGRPLPTLDLFQLLQCAIWLRAPAENVTEIHDAYVQARIDLHLLTDRIKRLQVGSNAVGTSGNGDVDLLAVALARKASISIAKLRAQYQAACAILLIVVIYLHAVLHALGHCAAYDEQYTQETADLTEQVLKLGEDTLPLRPLYSSGIPTTIVVAWGFDSDPTRRKKLENLMMQHQPRSQSDQWLKEAQKWQNYLADLQRASGAGHDDCQHSSLDQTCHRQGIVPSCSDQESADGRCSIM